jgi:hypothetical protein
MPVYSMQSLWFPQSISNCIDKTEFDPLSSLLSKMARVVHLIIRSKDEGGISIDQASSGTEYYLARKSELGYHNELF